MGRSGPQEEGETMNPLADLLFEANMLKRTPRSGFAFLGAGSESVAEHAFMTAVIALVMSKLAPEADARRLMSICLVHDLAEARTGDLNYVNKRYVEADEARALADSVADVPFGDDIKALVAEFNLGETLEAKLARDADQLALMLDLKSLQDVGYRPPDTWIPPVASRLTTDVGKRLAKEILATGKDDWWLKNFIDIPKTIR
jgi:putative hydrolase of HD superfamily